MYIHIHMHYVYIHIYIWVRNLMCDSVKNSPPSVHVDPFDLYEPRVGARPFFLMIISLQMKTLALSDGGVFQSHETSISTSIFPVKILLITHVSVNIH